MRVILFGDGRWATNSLIRMLGEGYSFAAIVTRNEPSESGLLEESQKNSIPLISFEKINNESSLAKLQELKADLGVSISYNQIFKERCIRIFPQGIVNFHSGKLPKYRGCNVINWAIINGESEIGVTAHFVDPTIDTGSIINQTTVPIGWNDSYQIVLNRIVERFPSFVVESLTKLSSGQSLAAPQSNTMGFYYSRREPMDEWIDWSNSSKDIYNLIRAISLPAPGAKTVRNGKITRIWKATYDLDWPMYKGSPGQVVGILPDQGVMVKTGDSTILLNEVQIAGSEKAVPIWGMGSRVGINVHELWREIQHLKKST